MFVYVGSHHVTVRPQRAVGGGGVLALLGKSQPPNWEPVVMFGKMADVDVTGPNVQTNKGG